MYQRWVYPVDKKRVNEFGFGGTDGKDETAVKTLEGETGEVALEEKAGEGRIEALRSVLQRTR